MITQVLSEYESTFLYPWAWNNNRNSIFRNNLTSQASICSPSSTGEIRQNREGIGKIVMTFHNSYEDPSQIKANLDRNLQIIKEYVS